MFTSVLLRLRGGLLTALLALGLAGVAAQSSFAHGGVTIAEGTRDGVTVLVQAIDANTPSGGAGVDISTVLSGPGTGDDAEVVYWVRPAGAKTFKVEPENDDAGVRHATISTQDRGRWRDWDVSAIVTLDDGSRIRVTNAGGNAPGPDPAQQARSEQPEEDESTDPAATTPSTTAEATDDAAAADDAGEEVADISGESDGAPAWAIPSFLVLIVIGAGLVILQRRRNAGDE